MLTRVFVPLAALVLGICWFGTLYETSFRNQIGIAVSTDGLFLGLSVLIAALVLAWSVLIRAHDNSGLAAHYVHFCQALGESEMSREDLENTTGQDRRSRLDDDGKFTEAICFTSAQARALDVLVYEGKILQRGDRYRLPGGPGRE